MSPRGWVCIKQNTAYLVLCPGTGLGMRVIANLNEVIYNALGIGPRLPKYMCLFA